MRLADVDKILKDLENNPNLDFSMCDACWSEIYTTIDNAPTVEQPTGEWIDYSDTFYKCPECGYLLEKYCPRCQNKVILPKGGETNAVD